MVYEQIVLIGTPIVRSVAGWLYNSLEDGIIQAYEWKKLIQTVLRMLVPSIALYYGLNLPPELSAAVPLLGEYIFDYFKKTQKE